MAFAFRNIVGSSFSHYTEEKQKTKPKTRKDNVKQKNDPKTEKKTM